MAYHPIDYASVLRSISKMASSLADLHPCNMDSDLKRLVLAAHGSLETCAQSINSPAPVFLLPPELLALIFVTARDMTGDYHELSRSRKLPLPMTVSQVCTVWREVATTSPLLWTKLSICPPWNLPMVRLWLARSGPCPIDLRVTATRELWLRTGRFTNSEYRDFPAEDRAFALWDVLVYHLPRCRSIVIETHDVFYPIVSVFRGQLRDATIPLPFLEVLSLQGHREFTSDYGYSQNILPSGAPALRDVKVGIPLFLAPGTYEQIVSLHLQVSFLTMSKFCHLISSCTALETLAIYEDFTDVWSETASPSLTTLSLTTLELYNTTTHRILSTISAPALRNLIIAPTTYTDMEEYHQKGGASSKFASLGGLTLAFDDYWPGENPLAITARCFTGVQEVTLIGDCAQCVSETLEVIPTDDDHAWPKLRSLSIRASDWCGTGPRLRNLITSRAEAGLPLKRIFVDNKTRLIDLDCLEELAEVVERDSWSLLRQDGLYNPCLEIR